MFTDREAIIRHALGLWGHSPIVRSLGSGSSECSQPESGWTGGNQGHVVGCISEYAQNEQRRFQMCTARKVKVRNVDYGISNRAQHRKRNFRVCMAQSLIVRHAMCGIFGHALGNISGSAQYD